LIRTPDVVVMAQSHSIKSRAWCIVDLGWFAMSVSASRFLRNVPKEEAFYFFTSIGNYTGQSATSLDEFLEKIKDVNVKSLEFHLYREDFERWVATTVGDTNLAEEIKDLRGIKVVGNAVRDRLYFIVSRHLKKLKSMSSV
jgi:hypothetical protein